MGRRQWLIICIMTMILTACAFPAADVEESSTTARAEKSGQKELKEEEELAAEQDTRQDNVPSERDDTADMQNEICDREEEIRLQDEEMTHSGIYVYAERDNGSESLWYPNERDFVAANGFDGVEPFFEYYIPEGSKRLTLYYDEAAQKGCGIRYYERDPSTFTTTGMYGFVFEGLQESRESGIREDYLKPEVYDGSTASDYVHDFTENAEYDDKGRITHYDAGGTFMRERVMGFETILWIDYDYYDNGNLKTRSYWHTGLLFGSSYSTWRCCFDEQGRIAYEDSYITHGSCDTYYIYMDDTKEPAYILDLDNCMGEWIPEFREGK